MKRLRFALCVGCALVLLAASAFARGMSLTVSGRDGGWLSFVVDAAEQVYWLKDEESPKPPPGLEEMYHWMSVGADREETPFIRMPNGYVLACAYRTEIGTRFSADELCALWPRMAVRLEPGVIYLNHDQGCASTVWMTGREWMNIQTTAVLDGQKVIALDIEAYANCDDGVMREIWIASPSLAFLMGGEDAKEQLQLDRKALQTWLESISLPEDSSQEAFHALPENIIFGEPSLWAAATALPAQDVLPSDIWAEYRHPEGLFTINIPENAVVIPAEQLHSKAETALTDLGGSAQLPLYLHWLQEAEANEATLITEPNYGRAMLIMFSEAGFIKTLDDIEAVMPAIEALISRSLTGRLVEESISRADLAGEEFIVFEYEGRYGERDTRLVVMGAVKDSVIYEVNLWEQDAPMSDEWGMAMMRMLEALVYQEASK